MLFLEIDFMEEIYGPGKYTIIDNEKVPLSTTKITVIFQSDTKCEK